MNTQNSSLKRIGRSLIFAAVLSSTVTVAERPEEFPRPELPAPSSKESLKLTSEMAEKLMEATRKGESQPKAAADKDNPREEHGPLLADDAKPTSRPEVASKPRKNSLVSLLDCYKFFRDRLETKTYGFSSLVDRGDGANRFEAWSGVSIKLGKERGILLRDGVKTYLVNIPSDGKEFERRLVLPPMKTFIITGKWEDGGYAPRDLAFPEATDGKEFTITFVPKKFYENPPGKFSVMDVAPLYAKRLPDNDPRVLAAFQKSVDQWLSLYGPPTVEALTKMNSSFLLKVRGKDALRRLGDPQEFLSQLNSCSEVLSPNNETIKGFHDDLVRERKIWENNYKLMREIDKAEALHHMKMRNLEELFQSKTLQSKHDSKQSE